jgi:hypothetical protein
MAIATLDQYIAAIKQCCPWTKTASAATLAAIFYTVFDQAGLPGAGVLNIGNTANGVVPTDAVAGYPVINAFSGDKGYFTSLEFSNSVACRIMLFDRVFAAGAYAFNADITLASQPSYSSRVPNGTDYNGLELWIEAVTAFTGIPAIQINYLDQDGEAGDTGSIAQPVALTIRRAQMMPLATGDYGVQRIDRVRCITATAGTFNVMVLRPLITVRVPLAGFGDVYDLLRTGMVQVFADSALYVLIAADSTSSGIPFLNIEIAN